MKHLRTIGIALVAVALAWALSPPAFALDPVVTYTQGGGLTNSPHDFTNATVSGVYDGALTALPTTGDKCITCHVPHRAQTQRAIWNHTLSTATYSWDESTTTNGTTLPTAQADFGNSRLCLSCHDGSVAVGDLATLTGSPTGVQNAADWGDELMGSASAITAGGNDKRVAVSGDISKNHPVAVAYAGETGSGISTPGSDWIAAATVVSNDNVRLYGAAGSRRIDCGSCHEPHNRGGGDKDLLRVNRATICAECHSK